MGSKLVLVTVVLALLSGCSSLQFRKVSVVGAVTDPETQSTRVSVAFEVWNADEQLTDLSPEAFAVYEDGRAASGTLDEARSRGRRVPVVLLLDVSAAIYGAGAAAELKRAASGFEKQLAENGFHVTTYRYAARIAPVSDISALPDSPDDAQGKPGASLYAAVDQAFAKHPDAIVVAFSASADDPSDEYAAIHLGVVEGKVLPEDLGGSNEQRVVHAIGFGPIAQQRDRQGVLATQALERLARNGSYGFARDKSEIEAAFAHLAQRLRNLRVYDYVSAHVSGRHDLVIEVRARGQRAETDSLEFVAGATALRAKYTSGGGLVWNGPRAAVHDAVETADHCAQAASDELAEQACAALDVIAQSTQDEKSVAAVRSFMQSSICTRFALSRCATK